MDSGSAKRAAAERAVSFVQENMIIGLGTGTTANFAIEMIGEKVRSGLNITAVSTSLATERLARKYVIPILTEFTRVDITIDGADEVDPDGNLIKGGGGALTREKIVASASDKKIIVVDDSKLVIRLGAFPLPVEVLPFGWESVKQKIQSFGCQVTLRGTPDEPFLTDNQNYVLDCHFEVIANPKRLHDELNGIAGVVENGLFIGLTDHVIIGGRDGLTGEKFF
ncbi:ribose-5-phosphate isomerase RpiA [bacterium]|nr:ribose-5-phosphate isomerase RpiA [bacterium]